MWGLSGWLGVLTAPGAVRSEAMAVGFGSFSPELNIVGSADPAAVFLRQAVGAGLLSLRRASDGAAPKGRFELALADSVHVSPDYSRWSLRLRRGAEFQSGRPISAEDVIFSLDRCRAAGGLAHVKKSVSRRVKTPYDAVEDWIDIEVESSGAAALPGELAGCPIWESASARLFGDRFGFGSNFVGAGPYRLSAFRAGHQYTLNRVGRFERLDVAGVGELTVRGFADGHRGLTALREGTIHVLFVEDKAVLGKAASDETLVSMNCGGFTALMRRDVVLSCSPDIDVAHLRQVR